MNNVHKEILKQYQNMLIENLTKLKTPEELFKYMNDNIKYGYVSTSGEIISGDLGTFDDYKLQTPEELLDSHYGVCWDQTYFEKDWFNNNKIENKNVY